MSILTISTTYTPFEHLTSTYLKIVSQLIHFAAILIIFASIFPYITDLLLESIPSLEIRNTGRRCSTMLASSSFLNTFDGDWVPDKFIIILKLAAGEIDKRRKDFEATSDNCQQMKTEAWLGMHTRHLRVTRAQK